MALDLDVTIDRGGVQTLKARVENVSSAVDQDLVFPQGVWIVDNILIVISNVGSPAVTIENVQGTIWHLTTGSVLVTAYSNIYSSAYSASSYVSTWTGSPIRLSEGDFLNYRNKDLEDGSSMDLTFYVNATRLR